MSRLMQIPLASGRWIHGRRLSGRMLLAASVVVLLVVLVLWASRGPAEGGAVGPAAAAAETRAEWFVMTRRDFDVTISAAGELEPKEKVEIKNEVEGRTAIVEIVDEGASVKQGDVLARLADDEIRSKIDQSRQDVEQALADKVSAEESLAIQRNEAQRKQNESQTKLALATLDLKKWEEGDDVKKQRDLELALEKAKRNLERTRRDLVESKALHAERFISDNELEDAEIDVIEAENELATAKLEIDVYHKFTRPKERQDVQSKVDDAQAELSLTIDKNQRELRRLEADLNNRTRTLELRQQKLAELEQQLAKTVVTAPKDGLVVYGTSMDRWGRGDPLRPGRDVSHNESLFILPDTRQMVAVLSVHEAMLPQVRIGQKVRVTIDARPGDMVEGEVTQIGVMAEGGRWWNPDVREYGVKVTLPAGFDTSLKPAMRCSGEIVVDHVSDALAAPVQAVFTEGDQKYCYVHAGGGKVRRQPVTVGRHSNTHVEMIDGLGEEQRVLLRQPQPGELSK